MIKQTNMYKASDLVGALEVGLEVRATDSGQIEGEDKGIVFYKDMIMAVGYHKTAITHNVGTKDIEKPVAISTEKAQILVDALNDNARWDSMIEMKATSNAVSFLIEGVKGKHFSQIDNKIDVIGYDSVINDYTSKVARNFNIDSLQDVCYDMNTDLVVLNEGQLEGITEDGVEVQREKVEIEYKDTPFVPVVVDGEYLKNVLDSISLSGEVEGRMYTNGNLDPVRFTTKNTTHILMPVRVARYNKESEPKRSGKERPIASVPF